jgi:two-component system cell cycle response regulator
MPAKVLIVDDLPANVRLLQAKLEAEYYEVLTAFSGEEALVKASQWQPDIILLDVMMPGLNGFEVCLKLKESIDTRHIPVILVTALDGRDDRLAGLKAGADDFLTKPIDDMILLARLKALVRLKQLIDEIRTRESHSRSTGLQSGFDANQELYQRSIKAVGNVLILDDQDQHAKRLMIPLAEEHRCAYVTDPNEAMEIAKGRVDLIVLNLDADHFDSLRWLAHARSNSECRAKPILGVIAAGDSPRILKAFELGVNDIVLRPVDHLELKARARTQIRRKRFVDFLRNSLDRSLEMALTDALTGLNNRRYMDHHLNRLMMTAASGGAAVSLLVFDMDHFKNVNDTHGHDIGDEVLKEFSKRLCANIRAQDMPCRMGGEEFVVIMPETNTDMAMIIAERVRLKVAENAFIASNGRHLEITVSVGVTTSQGQGDGVESMLKRADRGLYEAKSSGRNRVIISMAA